jgi:hypothetical protein
VSESIAHFTRSVGPQLEFCVKSACKAEAEAKAAVCSLLGLSAAATAWRSTGGLYIAQYGHSSKPIGALTQET